MAEPGDRVGVACGDVVGEVFGAAGGAQAGRLEAVLDREGKAVEDAGALVAGAAFVGRVRGGSGRAVVAGDDGVDLAGVYLGDVQVQQFAAGDLAAVQGLELNTPPPSGTPTI